MVQEAPQDMTTMTTSALLHMPAGIDSRTGRASSDLGPRG